MNLTTLYTKWLSTLNVNELTTCNNLICEPTDEKDETTINETTNRNCEGSEHNFHCKELIYSDTQSAS
jgi:hypothetical protein